MMNTWGGGECDLNIFFVVLEFRETPRLYRDVQGHGEENGNRTYHSGFSVKLGLPRNSKATK